MPPDLEGARRRIRALGSAGDVGGLIGCLSGGWEVAAPQAVDELVAQAEAAVPALQAALASPERFPRGWAAVALGRMGRREVAGHLLRALGEFPLDRDAPDSFFNVWEQAADLLADWSDPRVVGPLLLALATRGLHQIDARQQAAELLGRMADPRAVPALIAALQADSEVDRALLAPCAAHALERLGGPEAEAALGRWRAAAGGAP